MSVTICCFLVGGLNLFHVDIDPTKTVSDLKDKIKEKTTSTLDTVPPHDLTLYRLEVDRSSDELNRINQLDQLTKNLNMGNALDLEKQLSEIWSEPPPGKSYYIVVQAPKGKFIYCAGVVLVADVR